MRRRMAAGDMRLMCGWQLGQEGEQLADLWVAFNKLGWGGKLQPAPITFPATLPYGHAIGQAHYGEDGRDFIDLQYGLSMQMKVDVLLHEMVHQYLFQTNQNPRHNAIPWCREIMRLSVLFWGKEIWAAPSTVGKVVVGHKDGKQVRQSARRQPASPTGIPSASMEDIKRWPDSFGLHVPYNAILRGTFKVHKLKTVAKKKTSQAKRRIRQITKPKTKRR